MKKWNTFRMLSTHLFFPYVGGKELNDIFIYVILENRSLLD